MMQQFAKSAVAGMLLTGVAGATGPNANPQANQEAPKDEKVVRHAMKLQQVDWRVANPFGALANALAVMFNVALQVVP